MKINKSNNNNDETIVCPVCGEPSEIIKIDAIIVNTVPIRLHDDVGDIWQCMNPECLEYLVKVNGKYNHITRIEILRRQKEITDLLAAESEAARAMLVPSLVEAEIAKAEAGRLFSGVLYHLTSETMHHRAYSVEEILEACKAIGFNPLDVDNRRIGFVLNWLREHKGE